MFLSRYSSLIVIDYFSVKGNKSVGMEDKLWSNIGLLYTQHYPIEKHEVILDEAGKEWKQEDVRNYGRVKVNMEKLIPMVGSAIHFVQNFMPET